LKKDFNRVILRTVKMANCEVTDDSFSFKIESACDRIKKFLSSFKEEGYSISVSYTPYFETYDDLTHKSREVKTLAFEMNPLDEEKTGGIIYFDTDNMSMDLFKKVMAFHELTQKENAVVKATINDGWLTFKVTLPKNVETL